MPDGLSGEEQAIYFSKVRKFFDSYACSRVMERRKKMSDYIERQAVIDKINERQRKLIYCFGFENDLVKIMDIAKSIVIAMPSAQHKIIMCKDCIHNNDCDIQYSAQAGENFFCGFGETEKDVREDVYE